MIDRARRVKNTSYSVRRPSRDSNFKRPYKNIDLYYLCRNIYVPTTETVIFNRYFLRAGISKITGRIAAPRTEKVGVTPLCRYGRSAGANQNSKTDRKSFFSFLFENHRARGTRSAEDEILRQHTAATGKRRRKRSVACFLAGG